MKKSLIASFFIFGVILQSAPQHVLAGGIVSYDNCTSAAQCEQYAESGACSAVNSGISYYACIDKNAETGRGDCMVGCGVCTFCQDFPPNDCGYVAVKNCTVPTGGASCNTTFPSTLSVNWNYPGNQVRFTWARGLYGSGQAIGISEDVTDLANPKNCDSSLGANCVFFDDGLSTSESEYITSRSSFSPDTTYFWGVANLANPQSCTRRTFASTSFSTSVFPTPTRTPTPVPPAPTSFGTIQACAIHFAVDATRTQGTNFG